MFEGIIESYKKYECPKCHTTFEALGAYLEHLKDCNNELWKDLLSKIETREVDKIEEYLINTLGSLWEIKREKDGVLAHCLVEEPEYLSIIVTTNEFGVVTYHVVNDIAKEELYPLECLECTEECPFYDSTKQECKLLQEDFRDSLETEALNSPKFKSEYGACRRHADSECNGQTHINN